MRDTGHPDPLGHANDGVTPESDALYAAEEALGLLLHDAPAGEFSLQREAWNMVRAVLGMPVLPAPHGVPVPHGETFSRPDADALESNK